MPQGPCRLRQRPPSRLPAFPPRAARGLRAGRRSTGTTGRLDHDSGKGGDVARCRVGRRARHDPARGAAHGVLRRGRAAGLRARPAGRHRDRSRPHGARAGRRGRPGRGDRRGAHAAAGLLPRRRGSRRGPAAHGRGAHSQDARRRRARQAGGHALAGRYRDARGRCLTRGSVEYAGAGVAAGALMPEREQAGGACRAGKAGRDRNGTEAEPKRD
ncbi:hypothetical protein BGLA2_1270012 [Burkholderia gladioli]|nr:hypothetical protein BGLA2_1270012 [Burkholderia gladioli]